MKKNILFVGGGRRLALAKQFEKHGYTVFGYETEPQTPLSCGHRIFKGKIWGDVDIKQDILNCLDEIDGIALPLQDAAVPILASMSDPRIVVSHILPASICFDKQKLEYFMLDNFPSYYPLYRHSDGCIAKPRFGCGSKGITTHTTVAQKTTEVRQEFIVGQEYTVDAYFGSQDNKMVGAVPRKRIRVADGEVIESVTCADTYLHKLTRRIGEHLKLSGPTCFQYIMQQKTNIGYLIEINARFGGGSTLSIEAGFDMIDLITTEYVDEDKRIPDDWGDPHPAYRTGLLMKRTLQDHFFIDGE